MLGRESEAEMSRKAESNLVKASVPDYSAAPHIIIIREEMSVISNMTWGVIMS